MQRLAVHLVCCAVALSLAGCAGEDAAATRPNSNDRPEATATVTPKKHEGDGTHFSYGEPATYKNGPLEITVLPPVAFHPSGHAVIYDKRNTYAVVKGTWQKANVYFTVTLRNLSTTEAYDNDFTFSDVHNTGADDHVGTVSDDGIEGTIGLTDIPPGKSVTFKDGYSIASVDNVQYEIKFDGLIGKTFYFSR